MISAMIAGFSAYATAFDYIKKYRLGVYLFIPGLIALLFFVGLIVLGFHYIPLASLFLSGFLPDISWLSFLASAMTWILWGFLFILGLISYRYVVLIILSPFLSHLSEVVEEKVNGRETPTPTLTQIVSDLVRAIKINLRNLFWEFVVVIGISLVPGINFVAPVVIFVVQSYFSGFSLMDYTLERKRMSTQDTIVYVRQNKGAAIGLGAGFLLLNFIPLAGWALAPTLGTIAATINTLENRSKRL